MNSLEWAVAPHEQVRFADSLIGLAGWMRARLADGPHTLDELMAQFEGGRAGWPAKPDFTQLALAAATLFAIGAVRLGEADRLERVK
ncbi:MAG: hypothetical protein KatS3mg123_1631 [Burkholderiales bacterium]|nr:MAG: hypothetical protein KatS3mg123_1631 [Burkholderiales bacterium]